MKKMILTAAVAAIMLSLASAEAMAMRLDATNIPSKSGVIILPSKKGQQPMKRAPLAMEALQPDVLMPADQAREAQMNQPVSTTEQAILTVKTFALQIWDFVTFNQ